MSQAYALNQVVMKDSYCVNAFDKEVAYLKKFDTDRLLAGFYENAGLAMKKMRYPGWEGMLIGGHTLGHYLTAAAQAYANSQIKAEDKEILFGMMKALIDGMLECQKHSQGKPGFVFGAIIQDPSNVELQFDYVEQNKTNIITEAWVPWYTMHKLLDGIVNMYELTGYAPALELGSGIGDWTYNRASSWSEETHRTVLGIEYGGMNDALYELYQCTKKEEHLKAAHLFDQTELFDRIVSGQPNVLNNHHANTTIPKFLGALNRYLTVGDEVFLDYVKKFWDMVVEKHTYVTGGNSEWEHFGEDNILDAERTNCNNETCNTYNMLKMTRKLFMITGERKYADYYENTFINAILSSQNPETGMTMYFQPMATGYFKVYGTEFDKFWCCTGSGMENFTKLNDSIYFRTENGIITNLYLASQVADENTGITLTQEADLPLNDTVCFTVSGVQKKAAVLSFRYPDWAYGYEVCVNGVKQDVSLMDGYLNLEQEWSDGDEIKIRFEMKVTAHGLADCDNVFAFKFGPLLLSADLGTKDMVDSKTGVDVTIPAGKLVDNEYLTIEEGSVADYISDINAHFEKEPEGLGFTIHGVDQVLKFHPHYTKTRERYGIYWYFLDRIENQDALVEKRKREELRRNHIVDTVQPGYGQYENDSLHDFIDKGSVGSTSGGTTRHATAGGSFAYHMKVEKGQDHVLELHFLKEDNGKVLKISLGSEEIFNKKIHYTGKDTEYVVELPISKELIERNLEQREGTQTVLITFEGGRYVESARLSSFLYMLTAYEM